MKFVKILTISTLLLFILSCSRDDDIFPGTLVQDNSPLQNYNPPKDMVNGTIFGTILDESENPIANAIINLDGIRYATDENGTFVIRNQALDKNGTFFTVEKTGFFKGSRRFYPQEESINYVYVQLMELENIGQFDASVGGRLEGADNIEISFPENSIINSSNGSKYVGEVNVAAKYLDPTAENINDIMPGDLVGVNTDLEEMSLVSYGMMAVELFGENGEKLNLDPQLEATLSFPVPEEMLDNAPEEIPLWSFEEEEFGVWAEEGTARLEGNKYVGQVSHFSFWNCDAPFSLIEIQGQLLTSNGIPIANTAISIEIEDNNGIRRGITNNRGFFSGKMPRDFKLTLSIVEEEDICNIGSTMFGPFSEADGEIVNLGVISLEQLEVDEFTISGTVVDCNNDPVSNGLVEIQLGNSISAFLIEADGTFNIGMIDCNGHESLYITGTDIEALVNGNRIIKEISPVINCGNILACGNGICVTSLQFVGEYLLTLDGDAGLGYGPGYANNTIVEIELTENSGLDNLRKFSAEILPVIGGFGPYDTFFELTCEEALFQLVDSEGLGCGGGGIMFGPAFDDNGEQITASIDLSDDSEITLFFNEGFADGGCGGQMGETVTKMVLTKI